MQRDGGLLHFRLVRAASCVQVSAGQTSTALLSFFRFFCFWTPLSGRCIFLGSIILRRRRLLLLLLCSVVYCVALHFLFSIKPRNLTYMTWTYNATRKCKIYDPIYIHYIHSIYFGKDSNHDADIAVDIVTYVPVDVAQSYCVTPRIAQCFEKHMLRYIALRRIALCLRSSRACTYVKTSP